MDILTAILLGIIQGITEWFPVSSSGHLVLAQEFLNVPTPLVFDVCLHIATLFVVLIVFRKDILEILHDLSSGKFQSQNVQLAKFLVIASIPTAILGFLFSDFFESLFSNTFAVGIALLINGTILFATKFKSDNKFVSYKIAILTGIAQGIAIIPGISRSGFTISTALLSGIKKETAVKFSFLLFIPAAIGGAMFKIKDIAAIESGFFYPTLIGSLTAFLVGYFSLKILIKIVMEKKFYLFAFYCWILGIVVLIFSR